MTIFLRMKTYAVEGMTCGGCVGSVKAALERVASQVSVTLDPPLATFESALPLSGLNAALAGAGHYSLHAPAGPGASLDAGTTPGRLAPYYPLALVIGLIGLAAAAGGSARWMLNFMAGFFIVFGAFKLLDVSAFADAFQQYDIVAKRWRAYALAFPFIELAIGFAFLSGWQTAAATWAALAVSLVSAIGVIQAVRRRQAIQCACLGTVFKLPMSTVTITENLGMAAMAAMMLMHD